MLEGLRGLARIGFNATFHERGEDELLLFSDRATLAGAYRQDHGNKRKEESGMTCFEWRVAR